MVKNYGPMSTCVRHNILYVPIPRCTEDNTRPRVETACKYSCVRGLGGASRLTDLVAPGGSYENSTPDVVLTIPAQT